MDNYQNKGESENFIDVPRENCAKEFEEFIDGQLYTKKTLGDSVCFNTD